MANNEKKELKNSFLLHVAGATVKHESKFAHLQVLVNDDSWRVIITSTIQSNWCYCHKLSEHCIRS